MPKVTNLHFVCAVAFWLAIPSAVLADGIIAAEAVRISAQENPAAIQLRWISSPEQLPVDIFVSTDPNASVEEMELLAEGVIDGELAVEPDAGQRRYFALRAGEAGSVTRLALRLLPLEGGRNFRDLGGYEARDGRHVKWGRVYRSGVMNRLTDEDHRYLEPLGISTIVDFRSAEERIAEPTEWRSDEVTIYSRDYPSVTAETGTNSLFAALFSGEATPESMTAAMAESYYQIALDQRESYKEMFSSLLSEPTPLLFNCSAGKDRTGVAAALILEALDVPRDAIINDYSLSDDYVDYLGAFLGETDSDEGVATNPYAFMAEMPRELLEPLMASHPIYIETALKEIETHYGSVLEFIRSELEVSNEELMQLRNTLLE
jgi:protein-tyrosine phosphatase